MTIVDIGLSQNCIDEVKSVYSLTEKLDVAPLLKERDLFSHKGAFGKVLLIASSFGKMGAAVLASEACLRAGVGLLTVYVPRCGIDILQTSVPEAIVSTDEMEFYSSLLEKDLRKFTIGVEPGRGTKLENYCLACLATTINPW